MEFFSGKSPCSNCPYRKDAPLQKWDKVEFDELQEQDKQQFGKSYQCHKNNGSACKGWLINQWRRGLPNITLRLQLIQLKPEPNYMKSLRCNKPMFKTIAEMCEANYPQLTRR